MRKYLLATMVGAALAALAFPSGLLAQPVTQNQLSGNECWSVGQGPGGPSAFLCINVARSGHANVVLSGVTGAFTIGAASANVTVTGTPGMTALAAGGNLLITAQPSAAVITLPASPFPDGGIVSVCNASAAAFATNAVTLAANTNQTLAVAATLTTLGAGLCAREQWNQSQATWYRIQ